MSYELRNMIIGAKIYIAPFGRVVDGITVSADAKPDNDPTENWCSIGCLETASIDRTVNSEDQVCFVPGRGYVKIGSSVRSKELTIVGTSSEVSNLSMELAFMADGEIAEGNAPTNGFFVPMSGEGVVNAWVKLQLYEGINAAPLTVVDFEAEISLDGNVQISDSSWKPSYRFSVIENALNTGALYGLGVI